MKGVIACALSLLGIACAETAAPVLERRPPDFVREMQYGQVSGSYIVTLRSAVSVDDAAAGIARSYGGKVSHVYKRALSGFVLTSIGEETAHLIASHPAVLRVEKDKMVHASDTQSSAPWDLDRIDQRGLPLDERYSYPTDGSGVTAYIIDTGINSSHGDFGARAVIGADFVDGGAAEDCNGHGTHVAGTLGGFVYGVAKAVRLVAVKVLDCRGSGTVSSVIAAIDWVTANAKKPAVANLSLEGSYSSSLNDAVARSVAAGITYVVAAGNASSDACLYSPASEVSAITAGASDADDSFASFSNFGPCVDISAPGVNVTSDWVGTSTAVNTISGTSMAAPHVAGVAALYLANHPAASPTEVSSAILENATSGAIRNLPLGTADQLLYSGFASAPAPNANASVAGFSYSCTRTSCTFDGSTSLHASAFTWDFGDGTVAEGVSANHVFNRRGTFVVTLRTEPTGVYSTATKSVACTKKVCS